VSSRGRPLGAVAASRVLLVLSITRWLPVGLVFGLTTLLPLERGISLAELAVIVSAQGFVMLALELPTGGLADALGRRPVLLLAGVLGIASGLLFLTASDVWVFAAAMALQGVFRALDSGPLEAWFVDTAHAADPHADVTTPLSRAGAVVGLAIAGGALASGGLIAWDPLPGGSALVLPWVVALGLQGVHLLLTAVLVRETAASRSPRVVWDSVRRTPGVVAAGLGLLRRDRILRCLVGVEVFWAVGMIGFETWFPVRLSELLGGQERAGAVLGPAAAVAWAFYAIGAWLAGLAAGRVGVVWTAIAARILNGALVVVMGLMAGPVGLLAAYLAAYALHGANNPVHATLLHSRAGQDNRATVLSMNSMVSGACYSLGLLALGPLAEHTSTATAIVVAGAFSVFGAVLYVPALPAPRRGNVSGSSPAGTAGSSAVRTPPR